MCVSVGKDQNISRAAFLSGDSSREPCPCILLVHVLFPYFQRQQGSIFKSLSFSLCVCLSPSSASIFIASMISSSYLLWIFLCVELRTDKIIILLLHACILIEKITLIFWILISFPQKEIITHFTQCESCDCVPLAVRNLLWFNFYIEYKFI